MDRRDSVAFAYVAYKYIKKKRGKKRKLWIHPLNEQRYISGAFYTLYNDCACAHTSASCLLLNGKKPCIQITLDSVSIFSLILTCVQRTQVCGGIIELNEFYDHALFNARQKTHVCPQPNKMKRRLCDHA